MGNEPKRNNNYYQIEIDKNLVKAIENEIKVKNNRKEIKELKKFNNLVKKKVNNIKKSNFSKKFNKNEKGIKNISNLLNLIYDKNINNKFVQNSNLLLYQSIFNIPNYAESNNLDNNYNQFIPNTNINVIGNEENNKLKFYPKKNMDDNKNKYNILDEFKKNYSNNINEQNITNNIKQEMNYENENKIPDNFSGNNFNNNYSRVTKVRKLNKDNNKIVDINDENIESQFTIIKNIEPNNNNNYKEYNPRYSDEYNEYINECIQTNNNDNNIEYNQYIQENNYNIKNENIDNNYDYFINENNNNFPSNNIETNKKKKNKIYDYNLYLPKHLSKIQNDNYAYKTMEYKNNNDNDKLPIGKYKDSNRSISPIQKKNYNYNVNNQFRESNNSFITIKAINNNIQNAQNVQNDLYTKTSILYDNPIKEDNYSLNEGNNKYILYNNIEQKNILNNNNYGIIQNNNINNNNEISKEDNFQIKKENDKINKFNVNKKKYLDYHQNSNDKVYTKDTKINQENFTIKKNKKDEFNKKNNLTKQSKINNTKSNLFVNKNNAYTNRKNKNTRNKKTDISADKIKSKGKYTFQIDIKNLIKDDILEKSQLEPSKRYKNKRINDVIQYYKPFRFNLNDDY